MSPAISLHTIEHQAVRQLAKTLALPAFQHGSVWLAGAGPGDPGLITLLGLHALVEADVVLHDALVNEALLRLVKPQAQIVFAGKRAGKKSCKQSDISRTLVSLARKGARVLRLKGGDPFVFGRGGEEALALAQAGIPFRVIPGVTAGIGGLAYAGIPVTHRDTNHVVTFITGHGTDGKLPKLDWNALANGSPTLVFYMALAHAEEISKALLGAGRNAEEPAAIVGDATAPGQSVQLTTLGDLGDAARAARAPALLVVGENVRLQPHLDWLSALTSGKPLVPQPSRSLTEAS